MTGETFKASVIGELDDGTGIVFDYGYVDLAGGSVHIDTALAAGNFQTLVQDTMVPGLPTDYTFKRYRFACVSGTHIGEIGYVEVDPPVTGSISAVNRMPNELAVACKRGTGYATRRDRGRVFFGPIPNALVSNTNINKVDVAAYSDIASLGALNLIVTGVTLKPVILSAAGTYSGRVVTRTGVADVMVHRKSRRPRSGA